jgi:hypothetical protein
MDNQDAKKNGLVGIAGDIFRGEAKITNEEDVKRATDSTAGNNEDVLIHPQNYGNVQTQSVVETAREQAEKELAQIKAYNEEMLRRQKAEEAKEKAKRGAIRTVLVVFVIIIFIVIGWVVISALMGVYNPPAPITPPDPEKEAKRDSVDGYKCKTDKCYKMADMPDHRIILRDDQYFIFDPKTGEASLTTIMNQEYHSINAFVWGNDILVDLDPETDFNGLYSVTSNRMVTGFVYDSFVKDIKDTSYADMNWAEGQYIVGRKDGQYRLIRLIDGREIINGTDRVFVHDSFCIAFNSGGERRLYTLNGDYFKVTSTGSYIFIKGEYVVVFKNNASGEFELYDATGKRIQTTKNAEYDSLRKVKSKERINYLLNNAAYYTVPDGN